jgi:hypothetical protein
MNDVFLVAQCEREHSLVLTWRLPGGEYLGIPMKVVSDSDLIPVTCSEVKAVVFGAKRRWRSYGA